MDDKSKVEAFLKCGSTRLSKDDKVNIAVAVYLALEAINHTAPIGCDGRPAQLTVPLGDRNVVIQDILTQILDRLGAPIPDLPEVEAEEGHCVCGNKLEDEDYN